MDPFMERMIARADLKCKRGDKQEYQIPTISEEINLRRSYRTDASSHNSNHKLNIELFYSKESIPIRSPRKFIPNGGTLKKTCENKDSIIQAETVITEECPGFMKSKVTFSKSEEECEIASLQTKRKSGATKDQTFIPEAVSTPILARGRIVSKHQEIPSNTKTTDNEESKKIYPCLSGWNHNIPTADNIKVARYRNAFQEMNNNFASNLSSNLKQEHSSWFPSPCEKEKAQSCHRSKNETGNHINDANTCSILEDIQSTEDFMEKDKNFCVNSINLNVQLPKSISAVRDNTMKTFQESDKVNLEELDDMEDRVSELEIKVDGLKIDEISVPGIKQAQIITEILPLAHTQEIKGANDGIPIRNINIRNERSTTRENSSRNLTTSKSKENLERSSIYMSLKEPNNDGNLSFDKHNMNDYLNESNNSNQRCSILANASEIEPDFRQENDDTLTESSHDDHSVSSIHSGDFSFSCSCSTSISQSSLHHEIPNESLPFLILQNLSFNRKGQSNVRGSKPAQVNTTADNTDSAIQCDSHNEERSKNECSLKELKVNQLHRKVAIESTIMEQASKALSLCYSSPTFSGSPQQIEGERLLLLSTLRKQAFLDEIRRLEAQKDVLLQQTESIEIKVDKIRIHLMEDFLSKISTAKQQCCYHFICIVSHKENVLSTDVKQAYPDQPSIEFQLKNFKIEGQFCDSLSLCFRVYTLQVTNYAVEKGKTKIFARKTWETNKEKISLVNCHPPCICSCKAVDSETKLNSINREEKVQSIIRVPSFVLTARTELCLPKDLHKTSLQLEQYEPFCCNGNHFKILQDTTTLNLVCTLKTTRCDSTIDKYISKDHEGFLTRFSIISGTGAWQREWWCLKGTFLLSWKYPEDEDYLPPIRVIDLKLSTDKISPVPRRKCARSNTFLIKHNENRDFQDEEQGSTSLWEKTRTSASVTEQILSADTREEMDNWCKELNSVLYLLQSWSVISNIFQK